MARGGQKNQYNLVKHKRDELDTFKYALKSKLKNMIPADQKIWAKEVRDLCQNILDNKE